MPSWDGFLRIINIQWVRSAHFLIMFLLIAFFIHHIYSALLVGISERNGEMESIFTGWKFVPKRLVDEVTEAENQGLAPRRRQEGRKMSQAVRCQIALPVWATLHVIR